MRAPAKPRSAAPPPRRNGWAASISSGWGSWAAPPSSRNTAPTITARSGAAAAELAGTPRRPARKRRRGAPPPERLSRHREKERCGVLPTLRPHRLAVPPDRPAPGDPVPKYGAFSPRFRGCTEDKGKNGGVEWVQDELLGATVPCILFPVKWLLDPGSRRATAGKA